MSDVIVIREEVGVTGSEYTERLGTIVCGYDGSASSRNAIEWAGRLARCCDAEMIVVGVYDWNPMVGDATNQEMVDQLRSELESVLPDLERLGVRCRAVVETGDSRSVLLAQAYRHRAEAIVVGSRGRSQLAEILLGSVAHFLTHHSTIPVVVVPQPSGPAD
jgi:nucleotide-binding universal stress UspA family protein